MLQWNIGALETGYRNAWMKEEGVIRSRFDLGIVSFDLFHI